MMSVGKLNHWLFLCPRSWELLGYVRIFVLRRAQNGHSGGSISFGSVRTVYGVVRLSLPSRTPTKMAAASDACIPIRLVLVEIFRVVFEKNPFVFLRGRGTNGKGV